MLSANLLPPQIYDRADPAAGRSDHASFLERGHAACAISEDFFPGGARSAPAPSPNPHYHKQTDRVVHLDYAADIARAVAGAAWMTATA